MKIARAMRFTLRLLLILDMRRFKIIKTINQLISEKAQNRQ